MSVLFCDGFIWDRVSWTICPGLWTTILLISASWVARITCVSHQSPATLHFLYIPGYTFFLSLTLNNTYYFSVHSFLIFLA
jgi:hypothetical protein